MAFWRRRTSPWRSLRFFLDFFFTKSIQTNTTDVCDSNRGTMVDYGNEIHFANSDWAGKPKSSILLWTIDSAAVHSRANTNVIALYSTCFKSFTRITFQPLGNDLEATWNATMSEFITGTKHLWVVCLTSSVEWELTNKKADVMSVWLCRHLMQRIETRKLHRFDYFSWRHNIWPTKDVRDAWVLSSANLPPFDRWLRRCCTFPSELWSHRCQRRRV